MIVERVRAGLRNARAKGKRLGRPKRVVDLKRITELRAKGLGWKRIAIEMKVGVGTLYRIALDGSKIREEVFGITSAPDVAHVSGSGPQMLF